MSVERRQQEVAPDVPGQIPEASRTRAPIVIRPAVGSPNQFAPATSRMMPRKNVGSDHVKRLNDSEARSIARPRRHAAKSPSAEPSRMASTCDGSTSQSVLTSALPMRSATG